MVKVRNIITIIVIIVSTLYILNRATKGRELAGYNKLAAESIMHKDYDKAIEYYQKIIDENPNIAGAYLGIAMSYYGQNENEKAISYCNQAATVNPSIIDTKAYELCNRITRR